MDTRKSSVQPNPRSYTQTQQWPNENQKQDEDIKIYDDSITERIIIKQASISDYNDRACQALRSYDEITIMSFGNFMSIACAVAETLEYQKIAKVAKIETTTETPLENGAYTVTFGHPVSKVIIHLHRNELGSYLSGFYQRKVIQIFETKDKKGKGQLSYDTVMKLDLISSFHATEEKKHLALKEIEGKSYIRLPDFIRFASHCVHPKLRVEVFDKIVENKYKIPPGETLVDDVGNNKNYVVDSNGHDSNENDQNSETNEVSDDDW